jgi:ABC-type transport system involved in multi-copper enzyme maturation permease subunit
MKWLLWKDFRHNRTIVLVGSLALLLPYLLMICVMLWWRKPPRPTPWPDAWFNAAYFSLCVSQLTVALIGGNAFAGERVDRSAEFLASLPVTRKRILASKLLLVLLIVAVIWSVNSLILFSLRSQIGSLMEAVRVADVDRVFFREFTNTALTGLLFFGVAWFLSSFLTSPTFSICGSLFTPLVFLGAIYFIAELLSPETAASLRRMIEPAYLIFCFVAGLLGFAIGTWHYLRRVEP